MKCCGKQTEVRMKFAPAVPCMQRLLRGICASAHTHNGVVPPQNCPVRSVFSQKMGAQPLRGPEGVCMAGVCGERRRAAARRRAARPPQRIRARRGGQEFLELTV